MTRNAATSIQNKFTKGLITENTGLNFPEDAVTEAYNVVFDEKSVAKRRLGIDYESSYSLQAANRTNVAVASYYWKAAAGSGDNNLIVLQVGGTLYFYKQDDTTVSDDMIGTVTLSTYSPSGAASPNTIECDFASGNGYLFVSHPNLESFYVTYTASGPSVVATQITLSMRDFIGVVDSLAIDNRPVALTALHEYNIRNQGWYRDQVNVAGGLFAQVITKFFAVKAVYPSNADVWWLMKSATDQFQPETYSESPDNSPAPKGHFLLNPYEQDRATVSGVATVPSVTSNKARASTIAFMAGRVWYSGVTGQDFSNKIYFSQIVEGTSQIGQCFQANDPTSEDRFDLLPSDGGVISIPDAGQIIKLFPVETTLIVVATNGVWGITGSQGIGFTATDYSVVKVSEINGLSRSSFVSVAGALAWWNQDGIFIASGSGGGAITVNSLTDQTIKTFYDAIPDANKSYARGFFNGRTRVVQWVYRTTSASDMTAAYTFDGILNYNVITNAFYPHTVDNSPVSINGIVVIKTPASTTKYVCSAVNGGSFNFTFAEEKNTSYLDWFTPDSTGVDFSSYFVSGYSLHGDAQRKVQPTYVYLFNKTEGVQNVFDFRSQWNYSTTGDTGRWSSTQRITIPNGDYTYQMRRVKTRGSGLAMQFRVDSVTGQPFALIGWSNFETQNASV